MAAPIIPETDENKATQPEEVANAPEPAVADTATATDQPRIHHRLWQRLRKWLGTIKGKVIAAIIVVVVAGGAAMGATDLRYPVIGLIYKNHADLTVLDSGTNQPILGASVSLAGQTVITDTKGHAHLVNLTLGRSTLVVTKKAYKTFTQPMTVPVLAFKSATVNLHSAGTVLAFSLTDKISGQAIDGAEITAGDLKASTQDGKGSLVLLPEMGHAVSATIGKDGFNTSTITLTNQATTDPLAFTLTPAGKTYFLSNRTGRIDLYEANLDGTGSAVVLAGTGKEDSSTGILPSVHNSHVLAIVSSREGERNPDGSLRESLFLFDTDSHQLTKVEDNYSFYNFRAWIGDNLVYQAQSSSCSVIRAYNTASKKGATVVGSVNGACPELKASYDDLVFYSLTGADSSNRGFFAIKADGSGNRKLSTTPGQQVAQKAKDTLLFEYYDSTQPKPDIWQSLNFSTLAVTRLDNAPTDTATNYSYINSEDGQSTVFIDQRDGKTELYVVDAKGANERKLTNLGAVSQFVQWINNTYVVVSVTKSDENALYVVATTGGQPQKIADFYRSNSRTYGGGYNPNY